MTTQVPPSLAAGKIVDIKIVPKTDTFTSTSTSFVDITTMSIALTPKKATNRIMVMANFGLIGASTTNYVFLRLAKDGNPLQVGDAAGSRTLVGAATYPTGGAQLNNVTMIADELAGNTTARTYTAQIRTAQAGTVCVNRAGTDTDVADYPRAASHLIVIEYEP